MSGLTTGAILKSKTTGIRYRVIALPANNVILCTMDISKLELTSFPIALIDGMLRNEEFVIEEDEPFIFDMDDLSPSVRESFEKKRALIIDVEGEYGPDFLGLCGKKTKSALRGLLKKHGMTSGRFWRVILKYLQSGRMEYSLLDGRSIHTNKGMSYDYTKKPGRPPELVPESGVIRDDETIAILEEMTNEYLSSRNASYKDIYSLMLNRYYMHVETVGGVEQPVYAPINERPTRAQMENFIRAHSNTKQRKVKKTSEREFENDERLLLGDEASGAKYPGDLVEIDAQEADVSLISLVDDKQAVGRATVYMMVDVYSRVVTAVSVDFQMNSNQGITNLFMNLCDDKQEFCSWYGLGFDNPDMWPSNFIPSRIRLDRGAEMKSQLVEELCGKLGTNRQLVPGAMGSAKGVIEQLFHQLNSQIRVHMEGNGLIEKRHDSKHNEQAILTAEEFTRIVVAFVLSHNQRHMKGHKFTKDQLDAKVNDIPVDLWQYGVNKYGPPEPIREPEFYHYNLMPKMKARLSRDGGICLKGLWYMPDNDPELADEILTPSKKPKYKEVHYDPRHLGAVYYVRDGRVITAPLNKRKHENEGLENLTHDQWDYYRKKIAKKKRAGQDDNELLDAYIYLVYWSIMEAVKRASAGGPNNTTGMRAARAVEKGRLAALNSIEDRLSAAREVLEKGCDIPEKEPEVIAAPKDEDDEYDHYTAVMEAKLMEDDGK